MERQEQIAIARQQCMRNLDGSMDKKNTKQGKHRVRGMMTIMFFLFLFGMKEEYFSFEQISYETIYEETSDNQMIDWLEEKIRQWFISFGEK